MSEFLKTPPAGGNDALRQAVFAGSIFILPATAATLSLVEAVAAALVQELCTDDLQRAQFQFSNEEMKARVDRVRDEIAGQQQFHRLLLAAIHDLGFNLEQTVFDPLRLRAVVHDGHKIAAAAKAYSIHRDSWYANPQCQINWWIPLHDVTEEQTFGFYRQFFDKPVENDSVKFDYAAFAAQVGWQKSAGGETNIVYPTAQGSHDFGVRDRFACKKGDILIFSASQLHQTHQNASGLTRFSVDFRTVDLRDGDSGAGAPNTDNASSGSALAGYIRANSIAL